MKHSSVFIWALLIAVFSITSVSTPARSAPVVSASATCDPLGSHIIAPSTAQHGVMLQLDNLVDATTPANAQKACGLINREFKLLKLAGVRWVRVGLGWDQMQPKGVRPPNFTIADDIIAQAQKYDMSVLWLVDRTPDWDGPKYKPFDNMHEAVPFEYLHAYVPACGPAPHARPFKAFVSALATRYGRYVAAWEIRNEPNYFDDWYSCKGKLSADQAVQGYAAMVADAHEALHGSTGTIVIGGPGGLIHSNDGSVYFDELNWIARVAQRVHALTPGATYAMGLHLYPRNNEDGSGPVNYMKSSISAAVKSATLADGTAFPIWITEFDYPANIRFQPAGAYHGGSKSQASFLRDQLGATVASGAARAFWASLLDSPPANLGGDGGEFTSTGLVCASGNVEHIGYVHDAYYALAVLNGAHPPTMPRCKKWSR